GYVFHPRDTIPDRHFFIAGDGDLRRVNLSLVELDAAYWRNHLAFRDALRTQPETAANYARLKAELAALFPDNRLAYTDAKGAFVARVLAGAWAERGPGSG
ncbi:MAG: GrpB family protein, partial [Chloroflexota bacterium]|nr:GrpB family protein [Chloroflexota bacterium]